MDSTASSAQYPQAAALEESLKHLAIEVGDATAKPFRVDLVRVHGGKPPIYCVVIRSRAKEPFRQRLDICVGQLDEVLTMMGLGFVCRYPSRTQFPGSRRLSKQQINTTDGTLNGFLGLRNRHMLSILSGMVASVDIRTGKRSATCTIC
jgi:hypothetical protein